MNNNVSASNGQAGPYTFVLESSLTYEAAGRSVLPIAPGCKAPSILSPTTGEIIEISWKANQKTPATREQLIKWLRVPHPMGIGIACGPVSGITLDDGIRAALEVLDFDAWQVYEAFVQLAVVQGLDDLLARLHLKEQTPRPGIHLPYLCIEVAKNTPLAREKVGTLVVPVYSYPLECLTFDSLPSILTLDRSAHFLALAHEDLVHAIRLLSADHLHCLALPIWHIPAPRKHRVAASARRLSAHRQASQAPSI